MADAQRPTVLVVEDEPALRELVVEVLRDAGFEVEEVPDGAAALERLTHCGPCADELCAVVLDLMLPRIDGITVLRRLQQNGPQVPVVALSASSDHLRAARRAGACSTVAKPFDIDHLVETVHRHCA